MCHTAVAAAWAGRPGRHFGSANWHWPPFTSFEVRNLTVHAQGLTAARATGSGTQRIMPVTLIGPGARKAGCLLQDVVAKLGIGYQCAILHAIWTSVSSGASSSHWQQLAALTRSLVLAHNLKGPGG
jgi:hypothetical protein